MPRYIDADKLKEAWYTKHNITAEDHGACFVGFSELPRLIDAQPTADVVEVVRCRDCQFASLTYDGDCKYCRYLENEFDVTDAVYFDANDYCSHGERAKE